MTAPSLSTERLLLRQWKDSDLPLFASINADACVMEHFPSTLSTEESNKLATRIQNELREKPYGLWAVEVKNGPDFIGFVGLHLQDFPAAFTPCVEIGWRIARQHWGKGYALEAARKVMEYAFETLQLPEVVSFTTVNNERSIKLMEKLGMRHCPEEDFQHPKLPENHPLRPHVLYRKSRPLA